MIWERKSEESGERSLDGITGGPINNRPDGHDGSTRYPSGFMAR